ncbi:MAG: DivIVA domain-containing protein [Clostridiales bacterium]|nr:DivIVA domain-containing protein [Clostridiales bacterium]
MIRPIDIQEKVFTKAVRGYKEEEVNEFLDEITVDLDSLLNELRETREENSRLVDELERLKSTEGSVVETLQAAKSLMTDISASAEKRAEILLKNAELDAELMLKNAREESEALAKESQNIRARYEDFRNRYKRMLENELQRFESSRGAEVSARSIVDFEDLPVAEDEEPLETVVTQDTVQLGKL